jgi:hypothetical protein
MGRATFRKAWAPPLTVDLRAHDGDGLLVNRRGVPFLDHGKVCFAFLIALARFPPLLAQVVGGRSQGIGDIVEIDRTIAVAVDAIVQRVAGQELGMAKLAMLGPDGLPS